MVFRLTVAAPEEAVAVGVGVGDAVVGVGVGVGVGDAVVGVGDAVVGVGDAVVGVGVGEAVEPSTEIAHGTAAPLSVARQLAGVVIPGA